MNGHRIAALAIFALTPLFARAELSYDPMLGPGVRSRPAYDGSDAQLYQFVPVIRFFGDPWFVRSTQDVLEGGVRRALAPGLLAGLQLAYEPGRKTIESPFLRAHQLPDVDRGTSVGSHLEWDGRINGAPVSVLARLRQHTDPHRGMQSDLRLNLGLFRRGPFALGASAECTWASAASTRAFYNISAQESVATGLPAYSTAGGWLSSSYSLGWRLELGKRWLALGGVDWRHLLGGASASPLAERASNHYVVGGIAWRF